MICLPTGTGKTIVFSAALRYLAQQKAAVCLQDAGQPPPPPQSPLAAGQTFSSPGDDVGESHPPYSLRALVLAHRVELLQQTVEKLHRVWPGVQVTLVNADTKDFSGQVSAEDEQQAATLEILHCMHAWAQQLPASNRPCCCLSS
jgi:superfamily II DNA or RNA helicase